MSKLAVIYLPGLGDRNPRGQRFVVRLWRLWGVRAELFHMNWGDGEAWQPKFDRLLKRIDELAAEGKSIGLVGASAGAGAVINAWAARPDKVVGAVTIAGKINHPETIGPKYSMGNLAFVESARMVPASLEKLSTEDRQRLLSIFSIADPVVAKRDSQVAGARNRYTVIMGHSTTIAIQITLGAPGFLWFLKRQARNHKR